MNLTLTLLGVSFFFTTIMFAAAAETGGAGEKAQPKSGAAPTVEVRLLDAAGKVLPKTTTPKVIKTDDEWRRQLTAEQYQIARGKGTERAFCGVFYDQKQPGIYSCVCCGLPLFTSETKFHSGTGWPSFFAPVAAENVATHVDLSFGMSRTEILCARCDAHLGHVFADGPRPTGERFCVNSASLVFKLNTSLKDATSSGQH